MPKLNLDRKTLAKFLPDLPSIVAFERVLRDVGGTLPSTIEEANALAANAMVVAAQALAALADVAAGLEQLAAAPAYEPAPADDEALARTHLGTMATQNNDAVEITGGTINLNAGAVATPSFTLGGDASTGLFRPGANAISITISGATLADLTAGLLSITGALTASGQITSTIAAGTPPFVVVSNTLVPNLYVARAQLADIATEANLLTSPTAFPPDATDPTSTMNLANALKAAAIAKRL